MPLTNEEVMTLAEHRYWGQYNDHPDCRDPAHPGCGTCMPEQDEPDQDEGDEES